MQEKIGFKLIGLKTLEFATIKDDFLDEGFDLETGIDFEIASEKKQINVYVAFVIKQTKNVLLKLRIACGFEINPNHWEHFVTGGKITFKKDFLAHLTMLTVGSARGILHAKTEGTVFNKLLLPTINVKKIVNEDVTFPTT